MVLPWSTRRRRIAYLEKELLATQHSIFRQRQENAELIRQIQEMHDDDRTLTDLKKTVKEQRSAMARIRFEGKKAARERNVLKEKLDLKAGAL